MNTKLSFLTQMHDMSLPGSLLQFLPGYKQGANSVRLEITVQGGLVELASTEVKIGSMLQTQFCLPRVIFAPKI
jgi:hypothetical protein